jgi:hypothetical protein
VPKIFVNFRSDDAAFAAMLIDATLVERFGERDVFRDTRFIPLGQDFPDMLWGSLAESAILLAVIGPHWLSIEDQGVRCLDRPDDYVRREIEYALDHAIRVIPILIGDTPLPTAAQLPPSIAGLATRQYLRVWPRNAHRDLAALADELSALLAGDEVPPARPPAGDVEPARHYTVVAVEIDGFNSQVDAVRTRLRRDLHELLRQAADDAGLDWDGIVRGDRIDGLDLLVPAPAAADRVAGDLVAAVHRRLGQRSTTDPGLRLRIGMDAGDATPDAAGRAGQALNLAHALAGSPALASVLHKATRAHLALAVSDEFYTSVVMNGRRDIDPAAFGAYWPIAERGGPAAWIYVPEYSFPPGLPERPRPQPPPSPEAASQLRIYMGGHHFESTGASAQYINLGDGDQNIGR